MEGDTSTTPSAHTATLDTKHHTSSLSNSTRQRPQQHDQNHPFFLTEDGLINNGEQTNYTMVLTRNDSKTGIMGPLDTGFNTSDKIVTAIRYRCFQITLCTFFLINSRCNEITTDPQPPEPLMIEWSGETISYPGSNETAMQAIWGSSPTDVYIVGHNERGFGKMFYFNGNSWLNIPLSISEGGNITKAIDLSDIYGLSQNDIWAVGASLSLQYDTLSATYHIIDSAFIMHYNGESWREMPISADGELYSVWCDSHESIWTSGRKGGVYHYNGTEWTKYDMPRNMLFSSIAGTANIIYTVGNQNDYSLPLDSTGYFLYQYQGDTWAKIDSVMNLANSPQAHFGRNLWSSGTGLYSLGSGIFFLSGSGWVKLSGATAGSMNRDGHGNILAVGASVYRYDGIMWTDFNQFNFGEYASVGWYDCIIIPPWSFVIGNDGKQSYALRGLEVEN